MTTLAAQDATPCRIIGPVFRSDAYPEVVDDLVRSKRTLQHGITQRPHRPDASDPSHLAPIYARSGEYTRNEGTDKQGCRCK